jgi:CHAD domain-containing protein
MKTSAKSILLKSLDERWKSYRSQYGTCRSEFSEASVHDLRVSTRRLLAVLDLVRAIDPHPRLQKIRHTLKNNMDDFDDLRDLQVMLVEISEDIENLPQLSYFRKHLKKREAALMRVAYKQIKEIKISEVSERIKKTGASLEKLKAMDKELGLRLIEVVDSAYLKANQDFNRIDGTQVSTIHRFRLSFKKFRYLAEVVHPLIKDYPETYFERMHKYQSAMGDIQDAEIFLNLLAEYIEKHEPAFDPKPISIYYRTRLSNHVTAFMENKNEFNIFWDPILAGQISAQENENEPIHDSTRPRRRGGAEVRAGQSATALGKRKGKNEEDRSGTVGAGNTARLDPEQSSREDNGDGEDPGK